ncbi:MAG: A/G-specific adenine glycosylase [Verrucomicrobiota bacterium]
MADRTPQSAILAASKRSGDGRNPQLTKLVPALLDWFSANARDLPWRRTRDPYAIWVSEIMLQQTQVKTVIPYWTRWMQELPTIEAVAKASPAKIHKLWEGLGYYSRVRNLQKAARQIVADCRRRGDESLTKTKSETPSAFAQLRRDKHVVSYKFPDNYDDVLALPGIGRYTAGAICSIAFNQPVPILDGNVIRVLTRVFGIGENPREKKTNAQLWQLAAELVAFTGGARLRRAQISIAGDPATGKGSNGSTESRPTKNTNCSSLNQSIMELGALICTPRNPQCLVCPVKKLCVAYRENRVAALPNLGQRTATTARRFTAFVIERNGKFLVRQRPAGVVNAHLWEFPNTEFNGANAKDAFKSIFGFRPPALKPFYTVKHSITRYRITLEAWRVSFGGASSARPHDKMGCRGPSSAAPIFSGRRMEIPPSGKWLTPAQMSRLAFTAAHKKLASAATDCILFGP